MEDESTPATLRRSLGLFDATMLVMGGIVGAGIFMTPSIVAQKAATPTLILLAWLIGGAIALAGAFIYAELAVLMPAVGGQYAYIRAAFHPLAAFLYGWTLLLVTQSGGMAAVAVTFARYFRELLGWTIPDGAVACAALAFLTAVNCLGVRQGGAVQSGLMALKILAIGAVIIAGLGFVATASVAPAPTPPAGPFAALGAALIPVLFSYGGWQTSSFLAAELKRPERDLPRGLLIGVSGVLALYLGVSWACLRGLGADGLAASSAPASDIMARALGEPGRRFVAFAIALSTLGFLSQGLLTAPRVYFAMARDGAFFRSVASIHPKSRVPVVAIVLQGLLAAVIALSGRYEQILNYVVSIDFLFFGLTGAALFVLRARASGVSAFRTPGHPLTTLAFVAACWGVALYTMFRYPQNAIYGILILLAGVPVFFAWRNRGSRAGDAVA